MLLFAISFAAAGFYDALLWGVDAPGYMAQNSTVLASSLKEKLLAAPGYIVEVVL